MSASFATHRVQSCSFVKTTSLGKFLFYVTIKQLLDLDESWVVFQVSHCASIALVRDES